MAFIDDFTGEVANVDLELHTPSGGTAWYKISGNPGTLQATDTAGIDIVSAVKALYFCDDESSAYHETICRLGVVQASSACFICCCSIVDEDNFLGVVVAAPGSTGLRMAQVTAGATGPTLSSTQPLNNLWVKIVRDGANDTAELWTGGTGATPSWVIVGITETVTANPTATRQGLRTLNTSTFTDWITYFEAGALAASTSLTGVIVGPGSAVTGSIEVNQSLVTLSGAIVGEGSSVTGSIDSGTAAVSGNKGGFMSNIGGMM